MCAKHVNEDKLSVTGDNSIEFSSLMKAGHAFNIEN